MSKKTAAATASKNLFQDKFRLEFVSIPGANDVSMLGGLVVQTVLPGGEHGKSNSILYENLFVKMKETTDLHVTKFLTWLQNKSGELAKAKLYLTDQNGKDVLCAELEGLEILSVSGMGLTLEGGFGIGTTSDALHYDVVFKVGRVNYKVL